MNYKIAVLNGDGIGPEIVDEAVKVLDKIGEKFGHKFEYTQGYLGGESIDKYGIPYSEETAKICKESDSILLGSVGGPKWDNVEPDKRPEKGLLAIRKDLRVYTNLRPAVLFKQLKSASPLKDEIIGEGLDVMIVRELTGGIYFGPREYSDEKAVDTLPYTKGEIERIAKKAFEIAKLRGKKIEVDGLYLGKEPVSRFPIKPLKSLGYLIPNVYDKRNIKLWNPVIWEYPFTSKPQFEEDYARLEQIKIGFLDGIDFFKKRQSNPKEYFDKVVRFEITRLINKPKRNEVSVLGNITFDTGFVDFKKIKIVEMDKSQLGFIREIMRDLGGTFRLIYTHTSWTQGYIKYYRLRGIGIPVRIFKLLSKLKKTKKKG